MDYIKKLSQKARAQKPQKIVADLIILNAPNLITTVRKRWLLGESVLGGFIGEYSKSGLGQEYRAYKMSINASAGGNVDLTLTGALGAGLHVKALSGTKFEMLSSDSKYEAIGEKYGFEEFGLSDSEWQELQAEIYQFALETMLKNTYE